MSYPIVLSYMQAESLLAARKQGQQSVEVSPDLGISRVTVKLSNDDVEFPRGEQVSWQDMEKIKKATVNCFVVEDGGIRAIQVFSEDTNRMCSLLPTKRTPLRVFRKQANFANASFNLFFRWIRALPNSIAHPSLIS